MKNLTNTQLALIAATVAAWACQALYLVMPVDLIPDFVPVLGLIDDMVGLTGALGLTWLTATQLRQAGLLKLPQPEAPHELYEPIDEGTLRAL